MVNVAACTLRAAASGLLLTMTEGSIHPYEQKRRNMRHRGLAHLASYSVAPKDWLTCVSIVQSEYRHECVALDSTKYPDVKLSCQNEGLGSIDLVGQYVQYGPMDPYLNPAYMSICKDGYNNPSAADCHTIVWANDLTAFLEQAKPFWY